LKSKKQVVLRTNSGIPIIELSGDFSDAIKEALAAAYEKACQLNPKNIMIKFDEQGHIYSSGITLLVGMISEAEKRGQKIHATGLSNHFVKVFKLVALSEFIQIFSSEQEALAALK
jgi:anti-anti-sigma factor